MPVILTITPLSVQKQMRGPAIYTGLLRLLVALLLLLLAVTRARALPQEQERETLGSLTSIGEVYVNDAPAPAEITIFSGDRVRTGETGSATFNMSGKGSLKLSPRSQVLFAGKYEYTAELEAGAVVMNSISGPNGFTLRIGNDVLVPSTKEHIALASIDRAPDGSYLVTCSDAAIAVWNLQGPSGQFPQAGQALGVAPNGDLFPVMMQVVTPVSSAKSASAARKSRGSFTGWGYLGLAAGGAAGAAAALAHGGGKQPVSPAGP